MSGDKPTATVPMGAVIVILSLVPVLVGAVEWKTLPLKAPPQPPPVKISRAYCTRCHSDAGMLRRMRAKEGPTHVLFHADGSFIDPLLSPGVPDHAAGIAGTRR